MPLKLSHGTSGSLLHDSLCTGQKRCNQRNGGAWRRDTWDHLTTIEYEGEFYELAETCLPCPSGRRAQAGLAAQPPRPYLYRLRPISPGKVIRGLHHYRPDELLPPKPPGN